MGLGIDGGTLWLKCAKGLDSHDVPPPARPLLDALRVDGAPLAPIDPKLLEGVSRNAPCPCGSGKKFKHCHGAF